MLRLFFVMIITLFYHSNNTASSISSNCITSSNATNISVLPSSNKNILKCLSAISQSLQNTEREQNDFQRLIEHYTETTTANANSTSMNSRFLIEILRDALDSKKPTEESTDDNCKAPTTEKADKDIPSWILVALNDQSEKVENLRRRLIAEKARIAEEESMLASAKEKGDELMKQIKTIRSIVNAKAAIDQEEALAIALATAKTK
ncbi:hypothetical protein HYV10_01810 [Candidatus Dependentiae bacterium]|nr:hypothetical protein [Candidatus Dependentiae bacterium]